MITRQATTNPITTNSSVMEAKTKHEDDNKPVVVVGIRQLLRLALKQNKEDALEISINKTSAEQVNEVPPSGSRRWLWWLLIPIPLVIGGVALALWIVRNRTYLRLRSTKEHMKKGQESLAKALEEIKDMELIDLREFRPQLQNQIEQIQARIVTLQEQGERSRQRLEDERQREMNKQIEKIVRQYLQIQHKYDNNLLTWQEAHNQQIQVFQQLPR
jgi:hypothetical protein